MMRLHLSGIGRRQVLKISLLFSLLGFLPACSQPPKTLDIAAGIWQGYEFLFLAKRENWLDKNLVNLAEVPSNASSIKALRDGIVHGAALTLDEVLRLRSEGVDLTVVLVFNTSKGADMVIAKQSVQKLSQLAGKRIGYARGTYADIIVANLLNQAGLELADIESVELMEGNQVVAWNNDEVDAVVSYGAYANQLEALNGHRLFDTSDMPNMIVDVLAVRSNIVNNPAYAPALRQVIKAHFIALQQYQANPTTVAAKMAHHLNMSAADVVPSFEGIDLPKRSENQLLLGTDDPGLVIGAAQLETSLLQLGEILKSPGVKGLVSDQFL